MLVPHNIVMYLNNVTGVEPNPSTTSRRLLTRSSITYVSNTVPNLDLQRTKTKNHQTNYIEDLYGDCHKFSVT